MNISNASSTTAQQCKGIIFGDIVPIFGSAFISLFIADAVIEGISSITAIFGNTLLISAILTSPHLRTPSYWLIMCQSFSDLVLALTVQPLCLSIVVNQLKDNHINPCAIWAIATSMSFYLSAVSVLSSTALSIDRCLAVHLGIQYNTTVTTYRVRAVIIAIYIFSSIFPIIAHTIFEFKYKAVPIVASGVLCFLTIFFCYFLALKKLRNHMHEVGCQQQNGSSANHDNTTLNIDLNKYKRSIWTLILAELCFVICCTPAMVLWCYGMANEVDEKAFAALFTTGTLWRLTASINPAIHVLRMKDLRQAAFAVLVRVKSMICTS